MLHFYGMAFLEWTFKHNFLLPIGKFIFLFFYVYLINMPFSLLGQTYQDEFETFHRFSIIFSAVFEINNKLSRNVILCADLPRESLKNDKLAIRIILFFHKRVFFLQTYKTCTVIKPCGLQCTTNIRFEANISKYEAIIFSHRSE
jgi:hypothetical protein